MKTALTALALIGLAATLPLASAEGLKTAKEISAEARAGITFLSNDEVKARLAANPNAMLIDVRTESEYNAGHIPGARLIPRGVVEFRLAGEVRDPAAEIIVTCRSGSRAALVQKALTAQGYTNVKAHEGLNTWTSAGLPIENQLGTFIAAPESEAE